MNSRKSVKTGRVVPKVTKRSPLGRKKKLGVKKITPKGKDCIRY